MAAGLVQTRIVVLGDAWDLLKFFNDDQYTIDPKAAAKELGADAGPVLDAAVTALDGLAHWAVADIEAALKGALVEALGLKPRKAFGPIRVAITGSSVSPPLFESMELLGRERSLQRLRQAHGRSGVREKRPNCLVVCTSALAAGSSGRMTFTSSAESL